MAARRVHAWVAVGAAAVVLLFLSVSVQKVWSADFWGNLQTGERILETGAWPRTEEKSFTAGGKALVEVRWLYCVVTALLWRAGEWCACWGMAVVLGATWAVVVWPSRRLMGTAWGLGVLALGLAAGSARWVHRPELATGLCLALFLVGLDGARLVRGEGTRGRVPWWLVGVQVVWVNSHSLFMLGPALAWMWAGAMVVERVVFKRGEGVARGVALAAAVTGACWVNPYFHEGAMYAVAIWKEAGGATAEFIGELQSPLSIPIGLWRWDLWATLALVVVMVAVQGMNAKRAGLWRWGVVVLGVYLAASAQRSAGLVAIVGVWVTLANLRELVEGREWARVWTRVGFAGVSAASLAAAWYQASDRAWTSIGVGRETGVGKVEWDLARGAAEFVAASGADTRVFNSMRDGYYLGWVSRGKIKVFINGRTDVFGAELLKEYAAAGPRTWEALAAKWKINTAVLMVRGSEELIAHLMSRPEWALVYLDHRNVVFVRRTEESEGLIARHGVDVSREWAGENEPSEGAAAWKRVIGAEGRPWYTFGMAQTFLSVGSFENARRYLERTLERFPGHERARAELACVYRLAGRRADGERELAKLRRVWVEYSERMWGVRVSDRVLAGDRAFGEKRYAAARAEYEAAIVAGHDTAAEWKKLGYVREQAGELEAAEEAYRRSLAKEAGQHEVWYLLGVVQARRGEAGAARESLERALRIRPEYGAARRALEGLPR